MERSPIHYSLRHLRYFVAAADTLSFTAAAKQLHVSQPSVSTALADIEAIFGVQLFLRHHAQGLSLTAAGQHLLREARLLLRQAEELQSTAQELGGSPQGPIALGCLITLAPLVVPSLMRGLHETYPSIQLKVMEADQQTLFQRLQDGTLEAALSYDLQVPAEIAFQPLATLPPYVLLPPTHPLIQAPSIRLSDLESYPYVLLDLPLSGEYFLSLFQQAGIQPNIVYRSASAEVVRGVVASGVGFSLLNFPLGNNRALDGQTFVQRQLTGRHRKMHLGIMQAQHTRERRAVQTLVEFCRQRIPAMTAWPKDSPT